MAGDGEGPAGCHIDCPNQLIKSQVPLGGHRCPLQLSVASMHRLFLLSDLQRHCSFHWIHAERHSLFFSFLSEALLVMRQPQACAWHETKTMLKICSWSTACWLRGLFHDHSVCRLAWGQEQICLGPICMPLPATEMLFTCFIFCILYRDVQIAHFTGPMYVITQ